MEQFMKSKNSLVKIARNFWADESAQGMTEYILLLVAILAIAMLFKKQIQETVSGKLETVGNDIKNF
jgi:Flp pilus assembly pilin Flp